MFERMYVCNLWNIILCGFEFKKIHCQMVSRIIKQLESFQIHIKRNEILNKIYSLISFTTRNKTIPKST